MVYLDKFWRIVDRKKGLLLYTPDDQRAIYHHGSSVRPINYPKRSMPWFTGITIRKNRTERGQNLYYMNANKTPQQEDIIILIV